MTSDIYLGVDALVRPLRRYITKLPASAQLHASAERVIIEHYGAHAVDHPPTVNVGVLAVLSRGVPQTFHVRPSASMVVHETDLHAIPSEAPMILRGPGIIEARRPETGERLWGDIASLGWYAIRGADQEPPSLVDAIYMIGCHYPVGYHVARWSPAWSGKDLDSELPYEDPDLLVGEDGAPTRGLSLADVLERTAHHEFARQAARYLIVFGLLEQIDDGPLRFELDKKTRVRHVRPRDLSARGHIPVPVIPRPDPTTPIDPSARVLGDAQVRGHLKRVRVGEGRQKIRWHYVHGYSARRWHAPRWIVERDHQHSGLANSTLVFQGSHA